MTIRNLQAAFHPRSIAIVGASRRPGSVGTIVLGNVVAAGFGGEIFLVNPKYGSLAGRVCHARIADLPRGPDLAIIATPAATVPDLIAQLGAAGTRAALVLSAGITQSKELRTAMLAAARPHLVRIIGPNTIGLMLPNQNLNASFCHVSPLPGHLALLSQSGAMATTMIDWAQARGIGFSHVVSMGDMADVDFGDCLDMLARDREVHAVLLYLETVTNARKFMSAARALSRIKPIVAIKAGRHARSAMAATTHTGALAGEDAVFDAAFERAGIVRVDNLEDLFGAAQALTRLSPHPGGRTAIVTNGGGAGVMALDCLLDHGGRLAELSAPTIGALDAALPPAWSRGNPVDILGDAPPERFARALDIVARDPGVDSVLALCCPTGLSPTTDSAQEVARCTQDGLIAGKPLVAAWLGAFTAGAARASLDAAGIVNFETPAQAVGALTVLEHRARVQEKMLRVPDIGSEEGGTQYPQVLAVFDAARKQGRTLLLESEAKLVLSQFGLTVPRALHAATPEEVADRAHDLLAQVDAVCVKLVSKGVTHKSDVGGVVLNLTTPAQCKAAAHAIAQRLARHHPGVAPDGYSVQEMVSLAHAREVLIGTHTDPIFGPAILFGAGGVSAQIVDDTAMALPPLDDVLAVDLIGKTAISRLLSGYRDVPASDTKALIAALIGVSRLVSRCPDIESLDVNPLLVGPHGAIVLDARMVISSTPDARAPDRLALKPYPLGWSKRFCARDGTGFEIRPIRPTDAALYDAFLGKISAHDLRMRFNVALGQLPRDMLVRLTQIDYDREMAFVALQAEVGALAGIVRLAADPDHKQAEFAILVRSDMQGRGIGWTLLNHLLDYAKADGIETIVGDVYAENAPMLGMCRALGFTVVPAQGEPGVMLVSLALPWQRPQ